MLLDPLYYSFGDKEQTCWGVQVNVGGGAKHVGGCTNEVGGGGGCAPPRKIRQWVRPPIQGPTPHTRFDPPPPPYRVRPPQPVSDPPYRVRPPIQGPTPPYRVRPPPPPYALSNDINLGNRHLICEFVNDLINYKVEESLDFCNQEDHHPTDNV